MDWTYPPEVKTPPDLLAWSGNRLLARLLVQRGITSVETAKAFINPDDYEPADATDIPDLEKAAELLSQAINEQIRICVWGDFDVDGQTSTALLVSMLRSLGADVNYYIPNRLTEGHGIRLSKLEQILRDGAQLILTCDTGIEAHDAVEAVHEAGARLIITDHHDLGETLPPAEAVVNPKRLPSDHPLRELPGVGVAYKLAECLTHLRGQRDLAEDLLDLVALGIVADVAQQTGDTRYLLQRGLDVLRRSERPGLVTLISLANLAQSQLTAEHIGFWLGPRLNALGRLGDANQAVELLTTSDTGRARILAAQLDALNERRKMLVERTVVQALSQIADTPSLAEYNAIVLAAAEWHPGILGIAASRLVEQFSRPTILLTERDGLLRGSARSIAGCDIHQAIKTQANLLESFGGHPMAAGVALNAQNLADFRRGLSEVLQDCVANAEQSLSIDATVTLGDLDLSLLHTLQKMAPFGAGNPTVKFAVNGVSVTGETMIGRARVHRKVQVTDKMGIAASVIWWNSAADPLPTGEFDLALTINRDTYRKKEALQLVWVDAQEQIPDTPLIERQIYDLRNEADPLAQIDAKTAVFYATETLAGAKQFLPDIVIEPSINTLVIWQAPPGQDTLQQLVAQVQPDIIYIAAQSCPFDAFSAFMAQLMGLIKYSLSQYSGRLDIVRLATTLCHRPATVHLAIQWLVSQGKLRLITPQDQFSQDGIADILLVRTDNAKPAARSNDLKQELLDLLRETAAYRGFVQRANLSALGLE